MFSAIITGTGKGIGKAIAILLLKQGYFVYGISRKMIYLTLILNI